MVLVTIVPFSHDCTIKEKLPERAELLFVFVTKFTVSIKLFPQATPITPTEGTCEIVRLEAALEYSKASKELLPVTPSLMAMDTTSLF